MREALNPRAIFVVDPDCLMDPVYFGGPEDIDHKRKEKYRNLLDVLGSAYERGIPIILRHNPPSPDDFFEAAKEIEDRYSPFLFHHKKEEITGILEKIDSGVILFGGGHLVHDSAEPEDIEALKVQGLTGSNNDIIKDRSRGLVPLTCCIANCMNIIGEYNREHKGRLEAVADTRITLGYGSFSQNSFYRVEFFSGIKPFTRIENAYHLFE